MDIKSIYDRQGYVILHSESLKYIKFRLKMDIELIRRRLKAGANEYEMMQTNPHLLKLIGEAEFLDIAQAIGLVHPIASTLPTLRIDRPNQLQYLVPAHQDYWYSMTSENAMTIWFTLNEVKDDAGTVWVVPGSHNQGLLKAKAYSAENPYTTANVFPDEIFIPIHLKDNEVLVFSQMLVHKSGQNLGVIPRLTVQIRYNDLENGPQKSSFVVHNSPFTLDKQHEAHRQDAL